MTRREWCRALAHLCSPSFPDQAQEALLVMLPALQHVPDEMFCDRTVLAVAEARRRQSVPAWDEIMAALNHYRYTFLPDHRLHQKRLASGDVPQDRTAPSDIECAAVRDLLARFKAQIAQRHEREEETAPPPRPMRDVTLKGEALRQVRLARGGAFADWMRAREEGRT